MTPGHASKAGHFAAMEELEARSDVRRKENEPELVSICFTEFYLD